MKKQALTAIAAIALILASGVAMAQTQDDIPDVDPANLRGSGGGGGISAGTIYFSGALTEFGTVDPVTGDVVIRGYTFPYWYADIAICPDKTLWGVTVWSHHHPQHLIQLDPSDGSVISDRGPTGREMTGLVCDTSGALLGSDTHLNDVDKSSGAATPRALPFGSGCTSAGDLEFDANGDLYLTCFGGIVEVDPVTGEATIVGVPNGNVAMFGLASVNPMYALWAPFISEINLVTGALDTIVLSNPVVPVFFGAATLPRFGACCANGPGTQTPCIETSQWDCDQNHHVFFGAGSECGENAEEECNALFVAIESMSAKQASKGVEVRWTTSIETETVGFRVLRQIANGREKREEMVGQIVPGAGTSVSGASYIVVDDSERAALATAYVLEDIDIYGKVTRHGPIEIERTRTRGTVPTGRVKR